MTHSKRTIILFTVAAVLGSSAMTAVAQDASAPNVTAEQAVQTPGAKPGFWAGLRAKFSGGHGPRRGGGEMMQTLMIAIDADKSGSITQAEIDTFRAAKLALTDTSKDGALNLDEFAAAYNNMLKNRMVDAFQNLDDDGNGSITTAELDARFGSVVASMDRNGDGALSQADRPKHGGKDGKHRGGDRRGGDRRGGDRGQMEGGNN